jgi:hypothetical protein
MATLTLNKMWVNLVSTGAGVSGQAAIGRTEDYTLPGEVRTYAGGRRRSITSVGEVGTYKWQYRLVPRTTVDTLHSWIGLLVQVRDTRGRRLFGAYFALIIEEVPMLGTWCPPELAVGGAWHVGVSLTVVTTTEVV